MILCHNYNNIIYLCVRRDVCFSRSDRLAPARQLHQPERHQRGRRRVLWLSRESQPAVDEAHLVSQRKLTFLYVDSCLCVCVTYAQQLLILNCTHPIFELWLFFFFLNWLWLIMFIFFLKNLLTESELKFQIN